MADFNDIVFSDPHFIVPPPDDVASANDLTPPVPVLVSPIEGVVTPDAAITIDVTDDRTLRAFFIWVEYANGSSEMIYRDGAFLPAFWGTNAVGVRLSSVVALDAFSRSYRFVIARGSDTGGKRVGGWPYNPRIYFGAVDIGGNVS
jgi:hypothetical protein